LVAREREILALGYRSGRCAFRLTPMNEYPRWSQAVEDAGDGVPRFQIEYLVEGVERIATVERDAAGKWVLSANQPEAQPHATTLLDFVRDHHWPLDPPSRPKR
jgi:hypothetical protein